MPFKIYVTKDFDQMSQIGAELAEAGIKAVQDAKPQCVLGLATGNSPTGLYKHLAKAFNAGRLEAGRTRSFNLDEYVGLPGLNAQERAMHCKSYCFFMVSELFGLLKKKFIVSSVPWGALVDPDELFQAMSAQQGDYEIRGEGAGGRSVVIKDSAKGVLRLIKDGIIDAYQRAIEEAGGVDLQIIGVGGRGHVAFHESGIPFDGPRVLLVQLDENTIANAVKDGNFRTAADSPRYAVSMNAELVFKAKTVMMLANGARKTGPITESVLREVTADVPLSYVQKYVADGGNMIYVLDEVAAADLLISQDRLKDKGYELIDARGGAYVKVSDIAFTRDPAANQLI